MKISPVYEMPADKYNKKLAEALKQISEFKQPEWAFFVKTGVAKIRPPQDKDFWYKRAASILRQIYINKVVGVGRLKTRYGSKKNRGMKPERFRKGSGKIIRVILQQAEEAGLLEKYNEPGKRAGRKMTEKCKELMENIKEDKSKSDKKPISDNSQEQVDKEKKQEVKTIDSQNKSNEEDKQEIIESSFKEPITNTKKNKIEDKD